MTAKRAPNKPLPSQERLKELFHYDAEVGELYHREGKKFGTVIAGGRAGSTERFHPDGKAIHMSVTVDGTPYLKARVIWKYVTGEDPKGQVDHRDVNPHNNRFSNLRDATHTQNKVNGPAYKGREFKGVKQEKSGNWSANIRIEKKLRRLGTFPDKMSAVAARAAVAREHYGEFYYEEQK